MEVFSDVLSDAQQFASLANEWDELLESSRQQCYFMRWRWNFLWWTHLAPADAELRIVVCRNSAGTLVGLSPLYLRRKKAFRLIPIRELVFLGTGVGLKTSEYLDIATRVGYEEVATRSMAAALTDRNDWDRISCAPVPDDSPVMRKFVAALAETSTWRAFERAPYVDTSTGWSEYKRTLGRSMRRNVEYYARRLFKRYSCEFQRVETQPELQAALNGLVELHIAHWRSKGTIGSLADPVFQRFLLDAARNSLTDSRLRVWTLRIDGRIEAVLIGFLDNGVLHYFQKGHNPAFSKEDLGTALVSLCIRDCCDDPAIQAFDFMGGGAEYKEMWARQFRSTSVGEASRNNIRARAFALQHRLASAATSLYRAVTPLSVRARRRDWLRAQEFRARLRRVTQPVASLLAGSLSILNDRAIEWASGIVVSDVLAMLGIIPGL